jgi:hypothetical protein
MEISGDSDVIFDPLIIPKVNESSGIDLRIKFYPSGAWRLNPKIGLSAF